MTSIIVCSFSTGIDEMTRKDQRDPMKVFRVLALRKRFSVFEATDNQVIAKTIDYLIHKSGYIKTVGGDFPWTTIEITDAGRDALAIQEGVGPRLSQCFTDSATLSKSLWLCQGTRLHLVIGHPSTQKPR